MKKIFCTVALLGTLSTVSGQIERDKALHFIGGNLYGLAGAGIAKQISKGNRWWTFAGAIGGSTLIGLGKEAVDASQRENGWDNDDLLATILGGASVGVTIDIFTDHKRNKKRQLSKETAQSLEINKTVTDLDYYFKELQRLPTLSELAFPQGYTLVK